MASSLSDWLREMDFRDFFFDLEDYGWFHYVFPFLLVYAVVFTILNQVELFEDRKPVKVIIALVFALFAVAFPISDESSCGVYNSTYSVTGGCTIGDLMISLFPGITAFTLGILALYIVAAMLGVDLVSILGDRYSDQRIVRYILGGLGLLVVIYYFARGFGFDGLDGSWLEDFFTDPLLYVLIVFGLFFWYLSRDEDSKEAKRRRKRRDKRREEEFERDKEWYELTKGKN